MLIWRLVWSSLNDYWAQGPGELHSIVQGTTHLLNSKASYTPCEVFCVHILLFSLSSLSRRTSNITCEYCFDISLFFLLFVQIYLSCQASVKRNCLSVFKLSCLISNTFIIYFYQKELIFLVGQYLDSMIILLQLDQAKCDRLSCRLGSIFLN